MSRRSGGRGKSWGAKLGAGCRNLGAVAVAGMKFLEVQKTAVIFFLLEFPSSGGVIIIATGKTNHNFRYHRMFVHLDETLRFVGLSGRKVCLSRRNAAKRSISLRSVNTEMGCNDKCNDMIR